MIGNIKRFLNKKKEIEAPKELPDLLYEKSLQNNQPDDSSGVNINLDESDDDTQSLDESIDNSIQNNVFFYKTLTENQSAVCM